MNKKIVFVSIFASFLAAQVFTMQLVNFRLSIFRVAIILSVFLFLYFVFMKNVKISSTFFSTRNFSLLFMIFWFAYSSLSLIWVKNFNLALINMYFLGIGVITVILYKFYFRDKRDFKKVFAILTFSVLINNLIGWYEVISKNYIFLTAFNANYYSSISQRIPISMMGNPNDFALLTIFGLSISIPLIKLSINRIYLLLSYLFLTSNIILLFLTYSRSSLLGAIVIGLFYLLANFYKTRTRVFLSFIIAMIVFLIFVFTPLIYTRFIFFLDFDFNANFLNSELIRINLMKNGFHILNLTYGFGTGPGNLEYWISTYSIYPTRGITSMHNWWLEILVTYGLLIFILYLLFYFNLVKNLWKVHSRVIDKFTREFANGLLFFMLAFTISSFGSSSNFNKEWLWVIWGICIAFQGYTHRIIYAISSRIEVIT